MAFPMPDVGTAEFLRGQDVSLTPIPKPGVPGYLSVWHVSQNLYGMGNCTSSCAVEGIGFKFTGARKPP
jgi:hypothetical protein